jgi:4-amino-4-deoxy-L-arabinose transferase-like glycosyltransferase
VSWLGAAPQSRRTPRLTWLLFIAALMLRVGVASWQGLSVPPIPGTDENEYITYATSLAEQGEYRGMSPDVADQNHVTAYRTPGTSLVYAALFRIFGHRYSVIRLAMCLWGALACVVLLAIGREVTSETTAWLAAGVWAIYPHALLYSGLLLSESLGLLTFLLFLLVALRFARNERWEAALLAGATLGIAILVHPARLFMLPLAVIWAAWLFRRRLRPLLTAALIPVAAVLVIVPWTIRNYTVFHQLVPLSTGGGSAMLQGNNRVVVTDPKLFGYSVWDTAIPEYRDALRNAGDELSRDRIAGRFAKEWIRNNPQYWAFLVRAKLVRGFTPFLEPWSPRMYRLAELISWGPVLLLMLIGFVPTWWKLARRGGAGWLLHLGILHFVVVTLLFFGNSRYRYTVEPLALLIAAMTVMWFVDRQRDAGRVAAENTSAA